MASQNLESRATSHSPYRRIKLVRWDDWALFSSGLLPLIEAGGKTWYKPYFLYTRSELYTASDTRPDYASCQVPVDQSPRFQEG